VGPDGFDIEAPHSPHTQRKELPAFGDLVTVCDDSLQQLLGGCDRFRRCEPLELGIECMLFVLWQFINIPWRLASKTKRRGAPL
jgi:hypothetical protein